MCTSASFHIPGNCPPRPTLLTELVAELLRRERAKTITPFRCWAVTEREGLRVERGGARTLLIGRGVVFVGRLVDAHGLNVALDDGPFAEGLPDPYLPAADRRHSQPDGARGEAHPQRLTPRSGA